MGNKDAVPMFHFSVVFSFLVSRLTNTPTTLASHQIFSFRSLPSILICIDHQGLEISIGVKN